MITLAVLSILLQQVSGTVSGTITDTVTHKPIRGALVTTVDGSRDVSGDDGRYTLKHPAGTTVTMRVAVAGYSTRETNTSFADGDFLKLDVELHPLAKILGKITDKETGEPIERVLSLRRTDNSGGRDVLPNKDGTFEIGDLPPGDYSLKLRQDGDAIFSWPASPKPAPKEPRHSYGAAAWPATIHLEEGERRFVETGLPSIESHSVTGTIEVPGHEDQDVTVTLWHLGVALALPIVSTGGRSGPLRIDGLTRGEYGLAAEAGKGAEVAFGRESFSITDHDIAISKITLAPGASIVGTVRMAEENAALPGNLEVRLNSASGWGSCASSCMVMPASSMLTASGIVRTFQKPLPVAEGRFHAAGIAPDDYWPELFGSEVNEAGVPAMRGLPDGYAVLSGDDQPVGISGVAQIDFVLTSKPGAIAGVVRDHDQAPVAGANVRLAPASDSRRQSTIKSGPTGEFVFRNIAPGKYTVNGASAEVRPGQTVSLVVAVGTP